MAVQRITLAISAVDKELQQVLQRTKRSLNSFAGTTERSTQRATKAFKTFDKQAAAGVERVRAGVLNLRYAIMTLGGGAVVGSVVKLGASFETSLSNISTLLDKSKIGIQEYEKSLISLSTRSSKDLLDLSRGLYQVISAGIPQVHGMGGAMDLLDQAQQAATAGLTDTKTAVDALVTVVNSYSKSLITPKKASDVLFQTVKYGRTTFGELAKAIGRVTPIAAAFGVRIEEVGAMIVQLTQAGLNTNMAITALRNLIRGIAKPSKQSAKILKGLKKVTGDTGLAMSGAALRVKGLTGVLGGLSKATGGNVDVLARLFPNIRAMLPAVVAIGEGFEKYAELLAKVTDHQDATRKALKEFEGDLERTWQLTKNKFNAALIEASREVLPALTKELASAGQWLKNNQQTLLEFGRTVFSVMNTILQIIKAVGGPAAKLFLTIMGARMLVGIGMAMTKWGTQVAGAFTKARVGVVGFSSALGSSQRQMKGYMASQGMTGPKAAPTSVIRRMTRHPGRRLGRPIPSSALPPAPPPTYGPGMMRTEPMIATGTLRRAGRQMGRMGRSIGGSMVAGFRRVGPSLGRALGGMLKNLPMLAGAYMIIDIIGTKMGNWLGEKLLSAFGRKTNKELSKTLREQAAALKVQTETSSLKAGFESPRQQEQFEKSEKRGRTVQINPELIKQYKEMFEWTEAIFTAEEKKAAVVTAGLDDAAARTKAARVADQKGLMTHRSQFTSLARFRMDVENRLRLTGMKAETAKFFAITRTLNLAKADAVIRGRLIEKREQGLKLAIKQASAARNLLGLNQKQVAALTDQLTTIKNTRMAVLAATGAVKHLGTAYRVVHEATLENLKSKDKELKLDLEKKDLAEKAAVSDLASAELDKMNQGREARKLELAYQLQRANDKASKKAQAALDFANTSKERRRSVEAKILAAMKKQLKAQRDLNKAQLLALDTAVRIADQRRKDAQRPVHRRDPVKGISGDVTGTRGLGPLGANYPAEATSALDAFGKIKAGYRSYYLEGIKVIKDLTRANQGYVAGQVLAQEDFMKSVARQNVEEIKLFKDTIKTKINERQKEHDEIVRISKEKGTDPARGKVLREEAGKALSLQIEALNLRQENSLNDSAVKFRAMFAREIALLSALVQKASDEAVESASLDELLVGLEAPDNLIMPVESTTIKSWTDWSGILNRSKEELNKAAKSSIGLNTSLKWVDTVPQRMRKVVGEFVDLEQSYGDGNEKITKYTHGWTKLEGAMDKFGVKVEPIRKSLHGLWNVFTTAPVKPGGVLDGQFWVGLGAQILEFAKGPLEYMEDTWHRQKLAFYGFAKDLTKTALTIGPKISDAVVSSGMKLGEGAGKAFTTITTEFSALTESFADKALVKPLESLSGSLKGLTTSAMTAMGEFIGFPDEFGVIGEAVGGLMDGVMSSVTPLLKLPGLVLSQITETVVMPAFNAVTAGFDQFMGAFQASIDAMLNFASTRAAFKEERTNLSKAHGQEMANIAMAGGSVQEMAAAVSRHNQAVGDLEERQREAAPVNVLHKKIKESLAVVNSIVENLPMIVETFLGYVVEKLPDLIRNLAGVLAKIIPIIASALPEIVTSIIDALMDSLPLIIDALIMAIPDIVMALIEGLTVLVERLPEFIEKLLNSLIEMLPILFERLAESIPKLITAIVIAIPEIIIALTDAIPEIIGAVIEGIPTIVSGVIEALPKIVGSLIKILPRLVWSLIKYIPMLVAKVATGIAKSIVRLVGSAGSAAKDFGLAIVGKGWLWHKGGMARSSMAQSETSPTLSMFRALGAQTFATGGMVGAVNNAMKDNIPGILQAGEAVLSRAGVRSAGGEAGIQALNSGNAPPPTAVVPSGPTQVSVTIGANETGLSSIAAALLPSLIGNISASITDPLGEMRQALDQTGPVLGLKPVKGRG